MADTGPSTTTLITIPIGARVVRLSRRLRGLDKTVMVSGTIFLLICVLLAITPWIAPYDPAQTNLEERLAPPSAEHWFGQDHLGRDVFTRFLFGGRYSVTIAALATVIIVISGVVAGAVSARVGGAMREIVMRAVDVLLSVPEIVIALLLVAIFGPGYLTLLLALALAGWAPFARLTWSLTEELNTKEFIEAAESLGCSRTFIVMRHVVPNIVAPVAAMAMLRFGYLLITVGTLSYLGLGVQPPDSDWGSMLADGQPQMLRAPWLVIAPGAAIFITALSVTFLGQRLSGLSAGQIFGSSGPDAAADDEAAAEQADEKGR